MESTLFALSLFELPLYKIPKVQPKRQRSNFKQNLLLTVLKVEFNVQILCLHSSFSITAYPILDLYQKSVCIKRSIITTIINME